MSEIRRYIMENLGIRKWINKHIYEYEDHHYEYTVIGNKTAVNLTQN